MDEKLRENVIEAFVRAALAVGAKDYEEGMKFAKEFFKRIHEGIQVIETTEKLRTALDSVPPLTKREQMIALFLADHLPQFIRFGLKIAAKQAASDFSAFGVGRPPSIPAYKNGEVLNYVALLLRKGCKLNAAKKRTAQQFGCSLRNVERLWSKRETVEDNEALTEVTMNDVLEYLEPAGVPARSSQRTR